MHINKLSSLILLTTIILVQGCSTWTEPPATTNLGEVSLSIHLSNIGSLSKAATIDMENLYIELNSGTVIVRDTVSISGNSQIIVNNNYTDLVEGSWSVKAESRDINDIVIHSDSTTFTVIPANIVDVSLSLSSKYSMLTANFVGVADSVSRCELLVDVTLVADSSFAAQSAVGSTLRLSYDYLTTGVDHNIKLDAYGDMWGTEYLLYTGDTTVTVVAGADNSYTIILDWVGPDEAPPGTASVEITIGPVGTVTVNGEFVVPVETVTDIDGNVYPTIQIGDQIWMAENLKVTHYRDGTAITNVTVAIAWSTLTTEAYCIYNNNESNEVDTYGALYNWYAAVDSRNIAPAGWHVPTDAEWKELEMYLGMSQGEADGTGYRGTNEGSKLAGNSDLWNSGALETDSEFGFSGFTALPGGYRKYNDGHYYVLEDRAYFWLTTEYDSNRAWSRSLDYLSSDVYRDYSADKRYGFSIRCLQD